MGKHFEGSGVRAGYGMECPLNEFQKYPNKNSLMKKETHD